MSMYFIQTPATLYNTYINRLNNLVIGTDHRVVVELQGGSQDPFDETVLFNGVYTPWDGKVEVDLKDIIAGCFDIALPYNPFPNPQEGWYSEFKVLVSDADGEDSDISDVFSVCAKESLSVSADPLNYEIVEKCLPQTKQPALKHTTAEGVELLTMMCLDDKNGDIAISSINNKPCYYSLLKSALRPEPSTYSKALIADVSPRFINFLAQINPNILDYQFPIEADDPILSYEISLCSYDTVIKRSYIIDRSTGREKYFAFVNSYGGIDTLIMRGDNVLEPETEYPVADFGGKLVQRNDDDTDRRIWHQYSGRFDRAWKEVLNDFAETRQKYWKIENYSFIPIVVTECSRSFADRDNLVSFDFRYKRTGGYSYEWRMPVYENTKKN